MHILITGAGGMIGRKLTERLLEDGQLRGERINKITLFDIVEPEFASASIELESIAGDFGDPAVAGSLADERPDVIFHLAAIVSGEAESDFDKGYRINLMGTMALFDSIVPV